MFCKNGDWLVKLAESDLISAGLSNPSLPKVKENRIPGFETVKLWEHLDESVKQFRGIGEAPVPLNALEKDMKVPVLERSTRSIAQRIDAWNDAVASNPELFEKCREFARELEKLPVPAKLPEERVPSDEKWQTVPHPYWKGIKPFAEECRAPKPRELATRERMYGKKGTAYPSQKLRFCKLCNRRSHTAEHCELKPMAIKHLPEDVQELYRFVRALPKVEWQRRGNSFEESILNLPGVYEDVVELVDWAESTWGKRLPFEDWQKELFGWRGIDAIFVKWALGWPKQLLLLEITGSQSRWIRRVPRVHWPNALSTSSAEAVAALDADVEEHLQYGIYMPVPAKMARQILSVGVVDLDTHRRTRVIHNGKPVNFYEPGYRFRLPNIRDFALTLDVCDRIGSMDTKKAFNSRPVSRWEALMQCFQWPHSSDGKMRVYAVISDLFGRKNGPFRYQRSVAPWIHWLNKLGLPAVMYLDDAVYKLHFMEQARRIQQQFLAKMVKMLRFPVNGEKSRLFEASTCEPWIGFEINTARMTIKLTERKCEDIKDLCKVTATEQLTHVRTVACILGKLVAATPALMHVPVLCTATRFWLAEQVREADRLGKNVWEQIERSDLPLEVRAELNFWAENLSDLNGRPLYTTKYDCTMYIDTSDVVAAAVCNNAVTYVPLPPLVAEQSSVFREIYGALVTLVQRREDLAKKFIRIVTDSACAVAIWNRNGSSSKKIAALCRMLVAVQLAYDIRINWRWLRRSHTAISLCDTISKTSNFDSWTFRPEIREFILKTLQWPRPTIDACASAKDATLPRYISSVWDGAATAVDILGMETRLTLEWENETLWCNPPFNTQFMTEILACITETKVRALLVVPDWSAPIIGEIVKEAAQVVLIPRTMSTYKPPIFYGFAEKKPRWNTLVCGMNFVPVLDGKMWKLEK